MPIVCIPTILGKKNLTIEVYWHMAQNNHYKKKIEFKNQI